jgi:hypothetical protein
LAAIVSTADELLNCCSLSLLFDTLQLERPTDRSPSHELANYVATGQFYTALFALCAAGFAVLALRFEKQLSDLAIATFSTQVVFIFPLATVLFRPSAAPSLVSVAIRSMLVAFSTAVLFVVLGWLTRNTDLCDAAPVAAFITGGSVYLIMEYFQRRRQDTSPTSAVAR